jgi:Na+-driven multidrug efflux pump
MPAGRTDARRALALAVPVALQSVFMGLLSLTDQLMVGQLGDHAVGTTGISGQLTSLITFVLMGLVTGISAFTAQFWARSDRDSMRTTLRFSLTASLLIVLPLVVVGTGWPELLMRPFTDDATLIDVGSDYLRFVSASFLPTAVIIAASGVVRSMGKMKIPYMLLWRQSRSTWHWTGR